MYIAGNKTNYPAELYVFTDKNARKEAVVAIKATFDVDSSGKCYSAEKQIPILHADEHYGSPESTAIKFESDCVPPKLKSEVLVVAQAVAPKQPESLLEVSLSGPGIHKTLIVHGNRVWVDGVSGPQISFPEEFASMPITFDRAFGGSDNGGGDAKKQGTEMRNFVGCGFALNQHLVVGKPLPNIEMSGCEMRLWNDKPPPVGFGVVGRGWQPRIAFAGTYDETWKEQKLPFLPDNFDRNYFQSAPFDQIDLSLMPGQRYRCMHMSEQGQFAVVLPKRRIAVRFNFDDNIVNKEAIADTLLMLPNDNQIVMLWRTSVPLPRKLNRLRNVELAPSAKLPIAVAV